MGLVLRGRAEPQEVLFWLMMGITINSGAGHVLIFVDLLPLSGGFV